MESIGVGLQQRNYLNINMPIKKVSGGYKVANTTTKKPLTHKKALKQLAAIQINKIKAKHIVEAMNTTRL